MSKKSRNKGKVGEREAAAWLRKWIGPDGRHVTASRGVQHSGRTGQPDVRHSIPDVHIEVKRCEAVRLGRESLADALRQSQRDRNSHEVLPIVMYRNNRQPWMIAWNMDETGHSVRPAACQADHWMQSRGYRHDA